jgi:glutathione S-transferase
MIKFYGTSRSRSARSLWALEEAGVKYEHIPAPTTDVKKPEFLTLNPNGHIPVLDDDGHIIWESMAINLYVAEKYAKDKLWLSTVEEHGDLYKWSFFGMTECEPHLMTILRNRVLAPPEQRDEKAAAQAVESLKVPFKVIDESLKGREYLVGNKFSIADLNVAAVLSWAMMVRLDLSATPAAQAWLQKCLGREANAKVRATK